MHLLINGCIAQTEGDIGASKEKKVYRGALKVS